ncbi:MAG: hypothetical protein R3F31_25295 [Verrucomicrobiales bacterium]
MDNHPALSDPIDPLQFVATGDPIISGFWKVESNSQPVACNLISEATSPGVISYHPDVPLNSITATTKELVSSKLLTALESLEHLLHDAIESEGSTEKTIFTTSHTRTTYFCVAVRFMTQANGILPVIAVSLADQANHWGNFLMSFSEGLEWREVVRTLLKL